MRSRRAGWFFPTLGVSVIAVAGCALIRVRGIGIVPIIAFGAVPSRLSVGAITSIVVSSGLSVSAGQGNSGCLCSGAISVEDGDKLDGSLPVPGDSEGTGILL